MANLGVGTYGKTNRSRASSASNGTGSASGEAA